jgi:quercetin dioxygenase-like cupin family protein
VQVVRGKEHRAQPATGEIFTGEVERLAYTEVATAKHLRLGLVRFKPGGRTRWHTHTFEQGLVITEGRGIVATEDAEYVVEPGDVVIVPAGEKHWHGGTESTSMAHVSIATPGDTTVLEPVETLRTRA